MEEGFDFNKFLVKDVEFWMSIVFVCVYGLIGLFMGFFNKVC